MAIDIGPFGKKKKKDKEDEPDTAEDSAERRRRAREQAVGGYKRKGGILERLREGFRTLRGLGDATKPKK